MVGINDSLAKNIVAETFYSNSVSIGANQSISAAVPFSKTGYHVLAVASYRISEGLSSVNIYNVWTNQDSINIYARNFDNVQITVRFAVTLLFKRG